MGFREVVRVVVSLSEAAIREVDFAHLLSGLKILYSKRSLR